MDMTTRDLVLDELRRMGPRTLAELHAALGNERSRRAIIGAIDQLAGERSIVEMPRKERRGAAGQMAPVYALTPSEQSQSGPRELLLEAARLHRDLADNYEKQAAFA
jgi:hypothetical protein